MGCAPEGVVLAIRGKGNGVFVYKRTVSALFTAFFCPFVCPVGVSAFAHEAFLMGGRLYPIKGRPGCEAAGLKGLGPHC